MRNAYGKTHESVGAELVRNIIFIAIALRLIGILAVHQWFAYAWKMENRQILFARRTQKTRIYLAVLQRRIRQQARRVTSCEKFVFLFHFHLQWLLYYLVYQTSTEHADWDNLYFVTACKKHSNAHATCAYTSVIFRAIYKRSFKIWRHSRDDRKGGNLSWTIASYLFNLLYFLLNLVFVWLEKM